ncbi:MULTISPECIES: NAD(P)H-quinone oxidoreductase [Pseudomonas]|jgi:putative PIG3 family NAD(P)H quinone oxidoreductase|uniref:NAD(P)H quinone oxidoreductase, PIG3 family n=1 Tax=Pseudomonas extremorientalis TaxID=169669 RepID=A0A1H0WIV7_9PSED|nr:MULTISPECIES: NAD(P)H-quinone oxidoreductase [Pseudomonas]KAB0511195.1 zinc-binding dehydrogenase [Pseudomonas extremorientalis]OIN12880.1 NAD(P)H-quinone oxidoreductase [Pseudomonas extremorientalis]QZP23422.1 NAD(P)H-quinone oxidoreductase [Pseudomonas sp. DR208]UUN90966.1 NAD(P)H-quinone oxidoreductase [Pseudomonas extremorientalis]WLG59108.1 NAD(P)H-quinone oxidoreductase [Pseudomonas extremorientalis]
MTLPTDMTLIEITTPGGPEVLKPRQEPVPSPAPGEILIRVHAAGVNRPDALQRAGKYPMKPGFSPIPGLEVAGEVVALGEGVSEYAIGDRVCALTNGGGYAQYCTVPASQALPVPEGMEWIQAAAIPETFFTVWANLFGIGGAHKGQRVLIHGGTSGIGTTALMLCREFGIQAFATAGSEEKCAAIRALGAEAINYREQDFAEVIGARGVDVILDIMGGSYLNNNLKALAMDGRLVMLGFLGGAKANDVDLLTILGKRAVVTGSLLRARTKDEKAAIADQLREHVWPVLAAGRCLPMIDQVFDYTQADQAHARMEGGDHIGKIVLRVV